MATSAHWSSKLSSLGWCLIITWCVHHTPNNASASCLAKPSLIYIQIQYNFVHDVLNEFILCGDTEILAPDLKTVINWLNEISDGESGFCKQFTVSMPQLDCMCTSHMKS